MLSPPSDHPETALDQLLHRSDIWRGQSHSHVAQVVVDTGYTSVNTALLNGGWPTRSLVEVCQRGFHQHEWLLFGPALKASAGYTVLLNPPLMPFCQGLIQLGIDLDRLIVVKVERKADLVASFVELARSESCEVLLAWQQHHALSYTELRKCLLATNEGAGLCVLFRPEVTRQQSSPATLRLLSEATSADLQLTIFKQKGRLQQHYSQPIKLPLPKAWHSLPPHHVLDQTALPGNAPPQRTSATVMPLRRGKR